MEGAVFAANYLGVVGMSVFITALIFTARHYCHRTGGQS